jgi:hypothetical protein
MDIEKRVEAVTEVAEKNRDEGLVLHVLPPESRRVTLYRDGRISIQLTWHDPNGDGSEVLHGHMVTVSDSPELRAAIKAYIETNPDIIQGCAVC